MGVYIPNEDTQNYHFCRLQLVVETFGHLIHQQIKIQNSSHQKLSSQWIIKSLLTVLPFPFKYRTLIC